MVITELLEKNARLYGSEVSLVEINPSEERDRAVTWRDYSLIEMSRPDAPYRREMTWSQFDKKANRVANLLLSRRVPVVFVGIAFDSGGVASGPMTSTFLLPLAMGACGAVGGNVVTDAFGIVAMVSMAPLIAIQIMGLVYARRSQAAPSPALPEDTVVDMEEEST